MLNTSLSTCHIIIYVLHIIQKQVTKISGRYIIPPVK